MGSACTFDTLPRYQLVRVPYKTINVSVLHYGDQRQVCEELKMEKSMMEHREGHAVYVWASAVFM